MSSPSENEMEEIRATLEGVLERLEAEAKIVRATLSRLSPSQGREEGREEREEGRESGIKEATSRPAPLALNSPSTAQVHEVAEELQGLDRMRSLIESLEAETSLELKGTLLAAAERDLEKLENMAHNIAATGIFDSLDSLPIAPKGHLKRARLSLAKMERHRILGFLVPGEEEPYERDSPDHLWVTEMRTPVRTFLLSEKGEIKVLEASFGHSLMRPGPKLTPQEEGTLLQFTSQTWDSLELRDKQPLRPAVAADLVCTLRHRAEESSDPEQRHRLGEDNRDMRSVSSVLYAHLESALARSVEVRKEAAADRVKGVEGSRQRLSR